MARGAATAPEEAPAAGWVAALAAASAGVAAVVMSGAGAAPTVVEYLVTAAATLSPWVQR